MENSTWSVWFPSAHKAEILENPLQVSLFKFWVT